MSERKEMSTETRSLLAAVLCLVVIAGWSLIYKPPQPAPGPSQVPRHQFQHTPAAVFRHAGSSKAPRPRRSALWPCTLPEKNARS